MKERSVFQKKTIKNCKNIESSELYFGKKSSEKNIFNIKKRTNSEDLSAKTPQKFQLESITDYMSTPH